VIKYNFDLLLHPPHHTLLILAANIPADYLQALDGITVVIVQVLYIQWLHRPGDRPFSIRILQAVLSRAVTYTNTKLLTSPSDIYSICNGGALRRAGYIFLVGKWIVHVFLTWLVVLIWISHMTLQY